jgi:hypothetical protein
MSNVIDIKTRKPINQGMPSETSELLDSLSDEETESLLEALSIEI